MSLIIGPRNSYDDIKFLTNILSSVVCETNQLLHSASLTIRLLRYAEEVHHADFNFVIGLSALEKDSTNHFLSVRC